MNMTWVVKRTDTFLVSLKTIKKNKKALEELDKKVKRLQEGPSHVGGVAWESGGSCEVCTERYSSLVTVAGFAPGRPSSSVSMALWQRGPKLELEEAEESDGTVIVSHEPGLAVDIDLRMLEDDRS